jgi:hypothetical protein
METWEHLSRRMEQAMDRVSRILMPQPSHSRMEQKMVRDSKMVEIMATVPCPNRVVKAENPNKSNNSPLISAGSCLI